MIKRRQFVRLGALLPATVLAGGRAAVAQRAGSNAALPAAIPLRKSGPVEVVFKAPRGQPNGLAQGPNPGELWVQDRGVGRQVSLIKAADGAVIREIQAEAIGPSGLTMDDDGVMWTSDTHGVMLVAFDANDGHTLAKYFVPGACRMYEKVGDAPHRNTPLKLAYPNKSRAMGDSLSHNEGNDTGADLGPGRSPAWHRPFLERYRALRHHRQGRSVDLFLFAGTSDLHHPQENLAGAGCVAHARQPCAGPMLGG